MSNEKKQGHWLFVVYRGFRVLPSYVWIIFIKTVEIRIPSLINLKRSFVFSKQLLLEALLRLSDVQEISQVYVAGMRSVGKPWSRDGSTKTSNPFEVEFKLVRFPERR